MAYWFTDSDLTGSGEFVDTASVGEEFVVPAGSIARFRWWCPAVAPVTPPAAVKLWSSAGSLLNTVNFDAALTTDAWNTATPASAITVSAGTYRLSVFTSRYTALTHVLDSPVVRGGVTANNGYFHGSTDAFPDTASSNGAVFYADLDFTAGTGIPSAVATEDRRQRLFGLRMDCRLVGTVAA